MRRNTILALVAGCSLAGGAAVADRRDAPPSGQVKATPSMSSDLGLADEPKKHLSEIDVYLRDAMDHTKVLYETTRLVPGSLDATIQKEALANIDQALAGALSHLGHVRSRPEARVPDPQRVTELQRTLAECRSLVGKARAAVRSDTPMLIQSLSSQLFARLRQADEGFGVIAERANLTRVDAIRVPEREPVRGTLPPGTTDDEELNPLDQRPNKGLRDRMNRMEPTHDTDQPTRPKPSPPGSVPAPILP
jgi:hypothetical protein